MFVPIMDIKHLKYTDQFFIKRLIQVPLFHPLTLEKWLIGYAQKDLSLTVLQATKYRINELTEFMDAYTSN